MNSYRAKRVEWEYKRNNDTFTVDPFLLPESQPFKEIFFNVPYEYCGVPSIRLWDEKESGRFLLFHHTDCKILLSRWDVIPIDVVFPLPDEDVVYIVHEEDSLLTEFYKKKVSVKMRDDRTLPPEEITVIGEEETDELIEKKKYQSSLDKHIDFMKKYGKVINYKTLPNICEMTLLQLMNTWDLGLEVYRDQDCIRLLDVHHLPSKIIKENIFEHNLHKQPYVITFPKLVFKRRNELVWCVYSDWQTFKRNFLKKNHSYDIPMISNWEKAGLYHIIDYNLLDRQRNESFPVEFVVDSDGNVSYKRSRQSQISQIYNKLVLVQVNDDVKSPPRDIEIISDPRKKKMKLDDEDSMDYWKQISNILTDSVKPGPMEMTIFQLIRTWDVCVQVYYENGLFEIRGFHPLPCELLTKAMKKCNFEN